MTRRILARWAIVLLAAAALSQASCSDRPPVVGPGGEATLTLQAAVTSYVASLGVQVTAPDLAAPLSFNLEVSGGTAAGTIRLPAGSDRTITVRAFDANGVTTHQGSRTTAVQPGANPPLTLTLAPLTGDQPITVQVGSYLVTVSPGGGVLRVGDTLRVSAAVRGPDGALPEAPVRWASSNPAVATVDSTGRVTAGAAGQAELMATYNGSGGSAFVSVTGGGTGGPVPLHVPAGMNAIPLDQPRTLRLAPGWRATVWARVAGARFLAVAPNGDVLVAQPATGRVLLVRPSSTGAPTVHEWATSLRLPHDIVFYPVGGTLYVYVAESHQITRSVYRAGESRSAPRQVVVSGLPDDYTPELRGTYGHQLKNMALHGGFLYVSIASTCNACLSDTQGDPVRGSVYRYDLDGGGGRLFAQGIRNAEGLAVAPGTSDLWVVVNNRDNIAFPFHRDLDGDGSDDYGRVMQPYVDHHPPELFARVRDGGNLGWPFCNPTPDSPGGLNAMPFDRDVQLNADGSRLDCSSLEPIAKGIPAHSAPLGLTFLHGTPAPEPWRSGAVVAMHGSWNRTAPIGYSVAFFPWTAAGPGAQQDLATGWITPAGAWGRPVDVAVAPDGSLLVSDDHAGAIYRLSYHP